MRQLQKTKKSIKTTKTSREPIAEGIIPLNSRGQRHWKSVSNSKLISYAKQFINKKSIASNYDLCKVDHALYKELWKRKLLNMIGLNSKRRKWSKMRNNKIIEYARILMIRENLSSKVALKKIDSGLYAVLRRRKLMEKLSLRPKRSNWQIVCDADVIKKANIFIKKNKISGRGELQKADSGLYEILRKRKLLDKIVLDKIGFEKKQRDRRKRNEVPVLLHKRLGSASRARGAQPLLLISHHRNGGQASTPSIYWRVDEALLPLDKGVWGMSSSKRPSRCDEIPPAPFAKGGEACPALSV